MQRQNAADPQLEAALEQLLRIKEQTGMSDDVYALAVESLVNMTLGGVAAEAAPLPPAGNDGVGVGLDVEGEAVDVLPGLTAEEHQVRAAVFLVSPDFAFVFLRACDFSHTGPAARRVLLAARRL
jgi:hypothetical protein